MRTRKLIASLLVVSIVGLGLPLPTHAALIGSDAAAAQSERARIINVLDREEVRAQLAARGAPRPSCRARSRGFDRSVAGLGAGPYFAVTECEAVVHHYDQCRWPSVAAYVLALVLMALHTTLRVAAAAEPRSYQVTFPKTGNRALDAALRGSSQLEALREKGPVDPLVLVLRAQRDVARLETSKHSR